MTRTHLTRQGTGAGASAGRIRSRSYDAFAGRERAPRAQAILIGQRTVLRWHR